MPDLPRFSAVMADLPFASLLDWEIQETLCVSCPRVLTRIYDLHSYMMDSVLGLILGTVGLEGLSA